ncbi:GerAB/ArcD/ProY family transporter [Bacillus paranthracis]
MNRITKKISTSQVAIAISTALIADGFIVSSRSIAQNMQTPDIWISFFLGGLISLVFGYCCAKLAQYYPRQTIFQYSQFLLGKPIGMCIGLLYVIWYTMVAAYQIRILGEFTQQFLLNRTPLFIVMCLPILVGSYLLQSGIQPVVRFFQLFFPPTILVILIILTSGFF